MASFTIIWEQQNEGYTGRCMEIPGIQGRGRHLGNTWHSRQGQTPWRYLAFKAGAQGEYDRGHYIRAQFNEEESDKGREGDNNKNMEDGVKCDVST